MFKAPRQAIDGTRDNARAPAALLATQVVDAAAPAAPDAAERRWRAALVAGAVRWRDQAGRWFAQHNLAPDLAEDIGSRGWFRGLGTMLGLGATALLLWPDFSQVASATAIPSAPQFRDEYRSQMILPLALGGDSGRRMGATASVQSLNGVPERPTLQLVATLGQGDTLPGMLGRAGLNAADTAHVAGLVASVLPPEEIPPGTRFTITLGARPQPGERRMLQTLGFKARIDLDLAITRQAGTLALQRRPIAIDTTPLRIRGAVSSSLYRAARNAGAPVAAIQAYLQAIDSHIDLENDIAEGDKFDMIVAYKRSATGERQVGTLLYAGLEHAGRPRLQLLRWGNGGGMLDATDFGSASSEARTIGAPVAGHITSLFGMRRHPILGYVRMHAGVDFGAQYGSPIYAVADGVVSFAGRHGGHGNYVRLEHGGGTGTGYGHMSRIAVFPGMRVRAGQVIGYVGSTGLSTGPHLHFEAYQNNRIVNPLGLRFVSRPQVDQREVSAFKQRLNALLSITPGAALGGIAQAPTPATGQRREIDRLADTRQPDNRQPDDKPSTPRRIAMAGRSAERD